jgi:hypothetical protein
MSQNHGRDAPAINSTRKLSLFEVPFTEISFAAMIPSLAHRDQRESPNPFKLVEASD